MPPIPLNFHELPEPHSSVCGPSHNNRGAGDPGQVAGKWRPGETPSSEPPVATLSRFATRLIDRATGKAHSFDELQGELLAQFSSLFVVAPIIRTAAEGAPINGTAAPDGVPDWIRITGELTDGEDPVSFPDLPFTGFAEGGIHPLYNIVDDSLYYNYDAPDWSLEFPGGFTWTAENTSTDPTAAELVPESPATGTPVITALFATPAEAVGQLCIVGDDDQLIAFVCVRLSPVIWHPVGPFVENTAVPGGYAKVTYDGTDLVAEPYFP